MLKAFVDELAALATTTAFLANVVASVDERLIDVAWLVEFLRRCAVRRAANPGDLPMKVVRDVAIGADGGVSLRRPHRAVVDVAGPLTTIVTWRTWMAHHVDQDRLDARGEAVIGSPGAGDDEALQADYVERVCADPRWWRRGTDEACLGAPLSTLESCWLSTQALDIGQSLPPGHLGNSAYRLSCATGLSYPAGTWLLRYEVDATAARAAAAAELGRPTFADGGNEWFRVVNGSAYGRHCAAHGWGNTADLASHRADLCDGRPERVYLRIPFSRLPAVQVQLLGPVGIAAGDPPRMTLADFETMIGGAAQRMSAAAKIKSWLA